MNVLDERRKTPESDNQRSRLRKILEGIAEEIEEHGYLKSNPKLLAETIRLALKE